MPYPYEIIGDVQRENRPPKPPGITEGIHGGTIQSGSLSPLDSEYERAKRSTSNILAGRSALAGRGREARLESQGIAGIPGIQTAVGKPEQFQTVEQLGEITAGLDIEKNRAQQVQARLDFAMKMYREEKDEARKARWGQVVGNLTKIAVGIGLMFVPGGQVPGAVLATGGAAGSAGAI